MPGLDKGYGVLKCRAIEGIMELDDDTPHYQVHANDGEKSYRLAINVRSSKSPFDLLYLLDENFNHPIIKHLTQLNFGFTEIKEADRRTGGIALDYIRANLFDSKQMKPLPFNVPGLDNDLNEVIDLYIQRAISSEDAVIYVFGEPWGPETDPRNNGSDKIFDFSPNRGIHNIHMNQGNEKEFARENGVWQDGALLIHFPERQTWVAGFFAFQSQSFHTDDRTGAPLSSVVTVHPTVRIVAALVNPLGADPGKESVMLLNCSPEKVDLLGWTIADRLDRKASLDGLKLEPNEIVTVSLSGQTVQLGNDGGTITLLDRKGIKVDGVSYTKEAVRDQGWTIVF